jgi:hypothetical protein
MEPPFTTLEKGARTMKSLTGMGGMGNARELAEMLRQMGRGRDTVLAHITPEEAQMLMDAGGSGDTNPNTGLPEFQEEDFFGSEFDPYAGQAVTSTSGGITPEAEAYYTQNAARQAPGQTDFGPADQYFGQQFTPQGEMDIGFGPGRFGPEYTRRDVAGMAPDQFQRQMVEAGAGPGLAETLESKLGGISDIAAKYPRLAQAAGYSAQGLVGMLQAARARKQGREEAARLSALGAPLRAQGESLRQQALSGTLTPQQAAQQEAARARLRQTAAGRGAVTGTQAGMIENQLGRQRSELSQVNLNNALKQLNLANAYDEAAIKATMVADREADDYLSQIASNIGSQLASSTPVSRAPRATRQATPEITRRPELPRGEA